MKVDTVSLSATLEEVNALEELIARVEGQADARLWEQADAVVASLQAGASRRALAKGWLNLKTRQPYSEKHVRNVEAVVSAYPGPQGRPLFRDAYALVAYQKLQPEDAQLVWDAIEATAPDGRVTPAHVKGVAAVATDILASDAIDDGSGIQVPFNELSNERKAAVLRANLAEEVYERLQRQKAHVERKRSEFLVIVECASAADRDALVARLQAEGRTCRAK